MVTATRRLTPPTLPHHPAGLAPDAMPSAHPLIRAARGGTVAGRRAAPRTGGTVSGRRIPRLRRSGTSCSPSVPGRPPAGRSVPRAGPPAPRTIRCGWRSAPPSPAAGGGADRRPTWRRDRRPGQICCTAPSYRYCGGPALSCYYGYRLGLSLPQTPSHFSV